MVNEIDWLFLLKKVCWQIFSEYMCDSQYTLKILSIDMRNTPFSILLYILLNALYRNSCSDLFFKKGFHKTFSKLQNNTCARACFLIKLQRPTTLLKKRLWRRCFLVNFEKFLRTPFYSVATTVSIQLNIYSCFENKNI